MTDDESHDDEDFDPDHPDLQHEPPEEPTEDAADVEPGVGEETEAGQLPENIEDPPPADAAEGEPAQPEDDER
jgi:hypothetical protein